MKISSLTLSFVTATAVFTTGCTTNPFTGEDQASKTAISAGIGALAGAAIGAATGDNAKERRKRALIGAGVGGLAGAGVGAYMDAQEKKLREKLQASGVSVTRQGDNLILNMPGNITFRTGSPDLNANFFKVLDSVELVLKEYDKTLIVIAGHTDDVGTDENNLRLSQSRAESVGNYFVGHGVSANRIVATGYGESRPIASNKTAQGREQNRRVELTLEPITQK